MTQKLRLFNPSKEKKGWEVKHENPEIEQKEWGVAETAFRNNVNLTRLPMNQISGIKHHFIRVGDKIYALGNDISAGSKGTISYVYDKEGDSFVLKLTELDEITFPDIDIDTQEDFEGLEDLVNYLQEHPKKAASAEEIILNQKGFLLASGLVSSVSSDEKGLAIVMPYLATSLTKHLTTDTNISSIELLDYALQCITQLELIQKGKQSSDRHFIHGDVSISNFLIDKNKKITLVDFGSSVEMKGSDEKSYSLPPPVDERYTNVPPEYKKRECSAKSDVYRLAEVLQKLLPSDLPMDSDLHKIVKQMRCKEVDARPTLEKVKNVFSEELANRMQQSSHQETKLH